MEHLLASKVDIRLHLVRLALQVPINLHFPEKLPYVSLRTIQGPTPPLEEERGATSASVLDFFAKASTQSSTSPHHQMVEASAFTSVPPPHPVAGGRLPPSTLPAPRTLLPPAGLSAHQVDSAWNQYEGN